METITYKKERMAESFGVRITVGDNGFTVTTDGRSRRVLEVQIYWRGALQKTTQFDSTCRWHDRIAGVDPAECGIRVLDMEGNCIVTLDVEEDPYPFMKPRAEQVHITENYVSVPPALTITDEGGAVWTLGFEIAPKRKSPDGEFAFPVLRNGLDMLEIASRIERRSGKIKIFTCDGWKTWTGRSFF